MISKPAFMLLFLSAGAIAAQPPAPRPKPAAPPQLAPELRYAYDFRTRILGRAGCHRFGERADSAFVDGGMADSKKALELTKIGNEARAAGCLHPSSGK